MTGSVYGVCEEEGHEDARRAKPTKRPFFVGTAYIKNKLNINNQIKIIMKGKLKIYLKSAKVGGSCRRIVIRDWLRS